LWRTVICRQQGIMTVCGTKGHVRSAQIRSFEQRSPIGHKKAEQQSRITCWAIVCPPRVCWHLHISQLNAWNGLRKQHRLICREIFPKTVRRHVNFGANQNGVDGRSVPLDLA
jgi:hypothetical protein